MDDTNKRIWRQRIGLYGGVLLMLVVCWVFIWAYRTITIRRYGADLTPKKQVESVQTPFFSMEDPAYAQLEMGQTGYTIGQQGSLLCALAMAAGAQGVQVDPAQLNLPELYEDNVYQVERIDEVPGLENAVFESYTSFAEDRVREILGRGEACLCRVLRDGNVHWLVITGAQEDAFLALDPAGDGQAQPLEEKVYVLARLVVDKG